MNVLALEFSSPLRSVAIGRDGVIAGHSAEQGSRETHAFALIEAALKQAGLNREQVECVAIGIGPGSYAGIRIAIAIAQGWQLAREVRLAAVSSADAVAFQAHERGWRGNLETMIDAQRNELFSAMFSLNDTGFQLHTPFRLISVPIAPEPETRCVRIDLMEHESQPCLLPDAGSIARLAEQRRDFISGSELEPIYLRKAQFVKAPPARISLQG